MPPFYADLIHSKFSRACSRDCDLEHLALVGRRKGISVIGTGDFTHPKWSEGAVLEPGAGRAGVVPAPGGTGAVGGGAAAGELPGPVRFMLSVEISTIYKRAERTRKVHHLLYMPDLASAERCTAALKRIGNLASDGRPILGLDSRDLLEITLESGEGAYLVPAHAWTPWFSPLGSKSGFDRVEDCYADLAGHIFALETGLSADPEMWRVSGLDRYRLVSNSDAHSPPALGRRPRCWTPTSTTGPSGGPGDRPGVRGDGRVLPRGGQVPPGRPPQVACAWSGRDPPPRRPLPGLR